MVDSAFSDFPPASCQTVLSNHVPEPTNLCHAFVHPSLSHLSPPFAAHPRNSVMLVAHIQLMFKVGRSSQHVDSSIKAISLYKRRFECPLREVIDIPNLGFVTPNIKASSSLFAGLLFPTMSSMKSFICGSNLAHPSTPNSQDSNILFI